MEQSGVVIDLMDNGDALVRFKRSTACGHCTACFAFGSNEADITIPNTLHAALGDEVEISMHSKTVFKSSILAYGIPLVCLIIGVIIGSFISEIGALIMGIVFTVAGFFILRIVDGRVRNKIDFKPRMIRIINAEQDDCNQ